MCTVFNKSHDNKCNKDFCLDLSLRLPIVLAVKPRTQPWAERLAWQSASHSVGTASDLIIAHLTFMCLSLRCSRSARMISTHLLVRPAV